MARRPLPPIGFWSYARPDDELSGGQLSRLRSLIRSELQQQYGREPIQLFQDISAISHGSRWEGEIRRALENSTFFIPILSPNFLQSEWCVQEVKIFQERQERLFDAHPDLPRTSRIFPIHYIDVTGIDSLDPQVDAGLRELQWFDFREFRHADFTSAEVRRHVSGFVTSVRDLLRVQVEQEERASPPPEPTPVKVTSPRPAPFEPLEVAATEKPVSNGGGGKVALIAGAIAALLAIAALVYFLAIRRAEPSDSVATNQAVAVANPVEDEEGASGEEPAAAEAAPTSEDMDASLRRELPGQWGDNAQCSGETWEFRRDNSYQSDETGNWSVEDSVLTMTSAASSWRATLEWMDDGVLQVSPPGARSETWYRCPA